MRHSLFRLLKYFYKPYVLLLSGMFLSGVFFIIFEAFNVAAVFPIIASMVGSNSADSNSYIVRFIQKAASLMPIQDKFIAVFLLFLIINILLNVFRYINDVLTDISSYVIMRDFQKNVYAKIIRSDYQYFLDNKQGELVYRTITAPGQMIRAFLVIPKFLVEILKAFFIMLVLFSLSWRFTAWIVLIGIMMWFPTKWIAQKISYNTGKARVKASEDQSVISSESISGIRQIKVFLKEDSWIGQFFKVADDFAKFAIKDSLFLPIPRNSLGIISISFICIASIVMKMKMGQSFVEFLPVIGSYFYAFLQIIPSMGSFGQMHMQFMGGLPYAEAVYDELHIDSHKMKDGTKSMVSFNDSIRLDHVIFTYQGRHKTLHDINITFEKSKITALVGPSGSGKSTIIDLILRFYKPTSGKILIDGVDLSNLKLSSWLDMIGFVSQDTFIFNATIAENISFRFEGCDSQEVVKAAKIANAHDFISALPEGYNTIIGDRGLKLSGGQRQRVAIARAVFRKPEILIFDEATSSLDSKAEKIVQNAIDAISQNHTVIVIAHRLSTIVNADKIIVIDNGTIVEEGNHRTLMEKEGLYWRMYNEQNLLTGDTAGQFRKA